MVLLADFWFLCKWACFSWLELKTKIKKHKTFKHNNQELCKKYKKKNFQFSINFDK